MALHMLANPLHAMVYQKTLESRPGHAGGDIISHAYNIQEALCATPGKAQDPHLIRRSPLEDVYRRAHCMYATGP